MSNYKDPANVQMENGRSMADYIRKSPHGLRGVVVSPATPGGTPINYDPHDMSKVKINIVDPDGRNIVGVALADCSGDRLNAAIQAAQEKITGNDIDAIRERAAFTFEELAKMAATPPEVKKTIVREKSRASAPAPSEDAATVTSVVDNAQEEFEGPPIDKIDRAYSPLAAFGLKEPERRPTQTGQLKMNATKRAGPPQKLVYFEKEGIGTVPAFFHDIICVTEPVDLDALEETGFMVLIYDLRFEQNAARWFPPANDPYQRPWAAQINDDNRLYLVHTTGFQYIYDHREYCILSIERAVIAGEA
mgnify:CR=1 FL=1